MRFIELIEIVLSLPHDLLLQNRSRFQLSCCKEDHFCQYLVSSPHCHCHSYSSHCFCFPSNNYSYLHLLWSFETPSPERIRHLYVPSVLVKWHFQGHCKNPHTCFLLKRRKEAMETSRDNQCFFSSEHLYVDEKFTSVLKFKWLNCSIN